MRRALRQERPFSRMQHELGSPPNAPPAWVQHPDRIAPTLAVRAAMLGGRPAEAAGPERNDARVDLQLDRWWTERCLTARGNNAARARLEGLDTPHLIAGVIQDGTARGLAVAYEEARSLCDPEPASDSVPELRARPEKEIRRLRDVAVASGGSRIRWTRREGLLLLDRSCDIHAPAFMTFEDRIDGGTLDGFEAVEPDRLRRFWPQALKPIALLEGEGRTELHLRGRLGRGADGFECGMRVIGEENRERVLVLVEVRNDRNDHRLRARFVGLPDPACIVSEGSPPVRTIEVGGATGHAVTLVRACGRLALDEPNRQVATPGGQCHGTVLHCFHIGGAQRPADPVDAGTRAGTLVRSRSRLDRPADGKP